MISSFGPAKTRLCFWPCNEGFIDQTCSVKKTGYRPRFFAFSLTSTSPSYIKSQKRSRPAFSQLDRTLCRSLHGAFCAIKLTPTHTRCMGIKRNRKKPGSHFKFDLLISLDVQRDLCKYCYFISFFSLLKEITMEAFILLSWYFVSIS